ncbi:MAG: tetratricopeptide repeat protein, partial [Comamonas sp.]
MRKNHSTLVLPAVAVITTLLTGCAGLGLGKSEPMLSPAAKAAAEMPAAKDPVINTEETYAALVQQMQAKSLWFASLAHLDAMDRQWGVTTESRLLRADALRNVGQLSASTALYQGLLGTARDGAARYGLGRVAAEKGDFRSAAQQMEQARLSNPVDPQLLTDLGYAYLQARDLGAARMPLMQAAQLNPEDAQANVNLSLFLMINGQNQEAEL